MREKVLPVVLLVFAGGARAADYSFTGSFSRDDEQRRFTFVLERPAKVLVRTFSYAGGDNAAGNHIPGGGFDPTLSLFDSSGNLLVTNRDGGCSAVLPDAATSYCWDAYLASMLPAGTWQVVLTQSENLPNGPTLLDSFAYDGEGSFSAGYGGTKDQCFWDFSPARRTGEWAVDFVGVDSMAWSPGTVSILNGASFLSGSAAPNAILTVFMPAIVPAIGEEGLVLTIDGVPAKILFASATQVNFVVPSSVVPKAGAVVQLSRGHSVLLSTLLDITATAPAIFTVAKTGLGQAVAVNVADDGATSYNGSASPAFAAQCGMSIEVLGTGFGVANPPDADGFSRIAAPVTATIGGAPVVVEYAGAGPSPGEGVQQIRLRLPPDCATGAAVSIRLQAGSHATQAGVTIAIQ